MKTENKVKLLKHRVNLLKGRDTQCGKIIAKLQRKIKKMEANVND